MNSVRLSVVFLLLLVSSASFAQFEAARSRALTIDPDRDPLNFALVVGIDNYREEGLQQLQYTRNDAEAVAKVLESLGYRVNLLTNRSATREGVLSELSSIRSLIAPQDRFVFYFAGHAIMDAWSEEPFLAAYDSGIESVEITGLAIREVIDYVNRIESSQMLVLLDAALTGLEDIDAEALEYYSYDYLSYELRDRFAKGALAFVSSVDRNRILLPDRESGALTTALLDALGTSFADTDQNDIVSIVELLEFLDYETSDLAYEAGFESRPQVFLNYSGWADWPVAFIAGNDDVGELEFADKQRALLTEALTRLATDKSISLRTRLTYESLLNRWVESLGSGRPLSTEEAYALDESINILSGRFSDREKARMLESLESYAFDEIRIQAPQRE